MRKFVVKSVKGEFIIYEVEIEVLPSICEPGLKPGEWMARVLKPEIFHMKREKFVEGKKVVIHEPDVWCWHAFYDDQALALERTNELIQHELEFNKRKYGKEYTDADLAAAIQAIKVVML